MSRSEQSGGEKTVFAMSFLRRKVQLGCNASWSEKGGGFPKISKLRSYTCTKTTLYILEWPRQRVTPKIKHRR